MMESLIYKSTLDFLNPYAIGDTHYASPIYFPKKHTVMSWAKQRRLAKKRRKSK